MMLAAALRKRRGAAEGAEAAAEGEGSGDGTAGHRRKPRTIVGSLVRLCIGAAFAVYIQRRNAEFDESSVPAPEEPEFRVVDNATQIFLYDSFLSPDEVEYLLAFVEGLGWGSNGATHRELPALLLRDANVGWRRRVEGYIAAARKDPVIGRIERRIANTTGLQSHQHEDILSMSRMAPHVWEPRGGFFPAAGLHHDSDSRPHRTWTLLVFLQVAQEGGRIIFPMAGTPPREGELAQRHRHFALGLREQFGDARQNYSRSVKFDPGSDHPFMDLIEESCRGNYGVSFASLKPGAALLFPSDSRSPRTWYGECNVLNGSQVILQKYKELPLGQRDPEDPIPPYQPWQPENSPPPSEALKS